VRVRNTLSNESIDIPIVDGKTVRQVVAESGFVAGDEFSVRDKRGNIVDDQSVSAFAGQVVNLGLPGRTVVGG
jgi:hypothetical protein